MINEDFNTILRNVLDKAKNDSENDQYIVIVFKNGNICHYRPEEYSDYRYDGKYFIVIRGKRWIGLYNLDCLEYVEITTKEEEEGDQR